MRVCDGEPGISDISMEKVREISATGDKDRILVIDGMKIRRQLCWNAARKAGYGFADAGNLFDCCDNSLANEAVVVLAVNLRSA